MLQESESEDQTLSLKTKDYASDEDLDFEEVNSE